MQEIRNEKIKRVTMLMEDMMLERTGRAFYGHSLEQDTGIIPPRESPLISIWKLKKHGFALNSWCSDVSCFLCTLGRKDEAAVTNDQMSGSCIVRSIQNHWMSSVVVPLV